MTVTDSLTPVPVNGLTSGVSAIAAGWKHTCALTTGGGNYCPEDPVTRAQMVVFLVRTFNNISVSILSRQLRLSSIPEWHEGCHQ